MRLTVDPVETRLKAARQSLATSSDVARLHGLEYVKDDLWIGRHETGISVFSRISLQSNNQSLRNENASPP